MYSHPAQRLRSPTERVGTPSNVALPPPAPLAGAAPTEEQLLLRALRERDESAFESLLDRYYSPMLRLAETYVRSREEAEEVVQDTWLAVLGGLHRFAGRASLKTWIFRILSNRARTRARRESRLLPFSQLQWRAPASAPAPEPAPWAGSGWMPPDPEEQLLAEELHARIQAAIRRLPRRQREVITLRDLEGWSAEEVCSLLEISEANQRVLLHRARVKVRDALTEYLDAPEPEELPLMAAAA